MSGTLDSSSSSFLEPLSTKTRLRLRLHAANLPRQGRRLLKTQLPTAYAVVTSAAQSSGNLQHQEQQVLSTANVWGETERLKHSCHPQWTKTLSLTWEYGSKHYFHVHIFHDPNNEEEEEIEKSSTNFTTSSTRRKSSGGMGDGNVKSLGTVMFEVGDVLSTAYNTKVKRLREGGVVICRLEPIFSTGDNDVNDDENNTHEHFVFHLASASDLVLPHETRRNWTGGNLFHPEPDTILEISRQPSRSSSIATSTKTPTSARPWMTVWRSQPILNSLQPTWDRAQVDLGTLLGCQSRAMDTFRISVCMVKTDGRRKEIGFCETNVNHMIKAAEEGGLLHLQRSSNKGKIVGQLKVLTARILNSRGVHAPMIVPVDKNNNSTALYNDQSVRSLVAADIPSNGNTTSEQSPCPDDMAEVSTIVDLAALSPISAPRSFQYYVQHGLDINFGVALDFTSSNGDPRNIDSYHYQGDEAMNDYEETISSIGETVSLYNENHEYFVWGFGAKFGGECRHLFQCGPAPIVKGVDGILGAYKSVFQSDLTMSGPTEFLQVLQAGAARAKRLHDQMLQGNNKILKYMVLLIITDGVMASFEETKRKLGVYQSMPLSIIIVGVGRSSFEAMYRLCNESASFNITFVELRHYQHSPAAFGQAALGNLPAQICRYMQSQGL